jgi:uncharacterized protein (TIGR04255 family)
MRHQVSMNVVRSEKWPTGEYVGWEAIEGRFGELWTRVASHYARLEPKRVGLRYLNRMAVPQSSELAELVAVHLSAPEMLADPFAFQWSQTWARVDGNADLAATVNLAKIEIEDRAVAIGNEGILLDIDVFNLQIRHAPALADIMSWLRRAHLVENRLFEAIISDQLRSTFR